MRAVSSATGASPDEQLGDAEIQQLGHAGGSDQHVAWLQVAVDDELRVRVSHRTHHLHEQPHHVLQVAALAPSVDRLAVDILQRQVRAAVGAESRVIQHGYVRMLQPREDFALASDALRQILVDPFGARQLQRHGALHHAVGALRQPYRPHAAFGQLALQPPRADAVADLLSTHRADCRLCESHDWLERLAGAVGRDGRKQPRQRRPQVLRLRRQRGQPAAALRLFQVERVLQQSVETVPVVGSQHLLGGHPRIAATPIGNDAIGREKRTWGLPGTMNAALRERQFYLFNDTASSKRARSQSRRTVRSFKPRDSAISS